ncbi:MAG TPA: threonine--tRNA ligase [Planctomycetota bacterium]|nr:threonine--tRNA ligase [Planctomycetota bacterium]HRR81382.1 threonine--tRNA ligase [Planctomycetota bacterium]HRT94538.1 threonine--tRNA ligase [Planctomycetota bacterium]
MGDKPGDSHDHAAPAAPLDVLRHTAAHVMAHAVTRLFPGTKLDIGPAIADGFYYDFDLPRPLSDADLAGIEAEMKRIIEADIPLVRVELPRDEAIRRMAAAQQPYKVERLREMPDDTVSFYEQGEFADLCRGPHLPSTGGVGAFKLLSIAGAYWRGDEHNPMLTRLYGTAFATRAELDEHLRLLEEAKRRDHRKLGKELDLFSFHDEGPGFPLFHPKGMILWNELMGFWNQLHAQHGYVQLRTPILLRKACWEQSGHWDHYRDKMYATEIDNEEYAIKPMNCVGSMLYYRSRLHSYREFPLRVAEVGIVHRHEKSGELHGLLRVRQFTQDDAHIFMTPEQIPAEVLGVMNLVDTVYATFGLPYHLELSTRPAKSIGSDEAWEAATNGLRAALDAKGLPYKINEGDGAFYGPKIDFHVRDALNRTWQCATIQLDFAMPEQFDLTYVGADNQRHRPVMIHRVVYGAIERFIAVLIEHFAGAFPLWLAPEQVRVAPISEGQADGAARVRQVLAEAGVRATVDARSEKIGHKIREATIEKIPYVVVLGAREVEAGTVAVRKRGEGDLGACPLDTFVERVRREIALKAR